MVVCLSLEGTHMRHFREIEDFVDSASVLPFDVEDMPELGLLETFKLFQIFCIQGSCLSRCVRVFRIARESYQGIENCWQVLYKSSGYSLVTLQLIYGSIFFWFFECQVPSGRTLHRIVFSIICGLSSILGKYNTLVFRCIFHGLGFRFFLLLDWCPSKAREPSLHYCLKGTRDQFTLSHGY